MTLCSLCQSTPFRDLPELSPSWCGSLTGDQDRNQFYLDKASPPNELLGFPHQPSLEALEASAASCGVCSLINESVVRFIAAYRKAEQDPSFLHWDRHGCPVNFQLWLTRRLGSADGFLAFAYARSGKSIFLVGAVGFCVRDGKRDLEFLEFTGMG
jgi:hypothetical protein